MGIEVTTGLLLDGVFASEAIDKSGEILDIKGLDIVDFDEGKGTANYEHAVSDGKLGHQGEETVGRIIFAKKIFKAADCANDRERLFWGKVKLPFLYGVVRLFDGAGHEGAKAIAAIVRDSHANNEALLVGFSIEGSTLKHNKQTNRLEQTLARKVALTLRACNATAIAGLLADPNAPEGFEKTPVKPDLLAMVIQKEETKKSENPLYQRLGGSQAIYGTAVTKAMTAGNYNAAPGTLTGGAALQTEDRTLKAQFLAAHRDWNRVTPFRKFLKARMPEASDEFLDHYTDLVENQYYRLKKAVEVIAELRKAGKEVKEPGSAPPAEVQLTVQGLSVPSGGDLHWDDVQGALVTPRGVFHASTPARPHPNLVEHLRGIGRDPAEIRPAFAQAMQLARPHHQRAMQNWLRANATFTTGRHSASTVAHAVAFGMLSPGIPVPMQEAMTGHLVDAERATGKNLANPEDFESIAKDWMTRNRKGWPEHSREHFRALETQLRSKAFDEGANKWGKNPIFAGSGAFMGFNKPNKFIEYFDHYLKHHHQDIVDAVRDSHGDGHLLARQLVKVKGVAPKLARYISGMLGAGDMVVPDTHFLRHFFGTQPERPGTKRSIDADTQEYLKSKVVGSAASMDIMEGIDRHYATNHDAVPAILNDPTIGQYFKGRESQALFPAFWLHWIGIPAHENAIGIANTNAFNAATDHHPYWDRTLWGAGKVQKAEPGYDPSLPIKTAIQHHRWVEDYGPVHAMQLYFRELMPQLEANDRQLQQAQLHKAEELSVEFLSKAKTAIPAVTGEHVPAAQEGATVFKQLPETEITFQGKKVRPGHATHFPDPNSVKGQPLALLSASDEGFIGVDPNHLHDYSPQDLVRIPREGDVTVRRFPVNLEESGVVDPAKHGIARYMRHPEVQSFVAGMDFTQPRTGGLTGITMGRNWWGKNAAGQHAYVKTANPNEAGGFGDAHREALFHNAAKDFFGLGQYVPKVGLLRSPRTGQHAAVVEGLEGDHYEATNDDHVAARKANHGVFSRAAVMDFAMGMSDRHNRNWFWTKTGKGMEPRFIDHSQSMSDTSGEIPEPSYINPIHDDVYAVGSPDFSSRMPPEDVNWASELDPHEFDTYVRAHGVPEERIAAATKRLQLMQQTIRADPKATLSQIWQAADIANRRKE